MNEYPKVVSTLEMRRNAILTDINRLQTDLDQATQELETRLSLLEDGKYDAADVSNSLVSIDTYALPRYISSLNSRIRQLFDEYISLEP